MESIEHRPTETTSPRTPVETAPRIARGHREHVIGEDRPVPSYLDWSLGTWAVGGAAPARASLPNVAPETSVIVTGRPAQIGTHGVSS